MKDQSVQSSSNQPQLDGSAEIWARPESSGPDAGDQRPDVGPLHASRPRPVLVVVQPGVSARAIAANVEGTMR